jgi:iron-sulfur cluster assembly protein
MFSYHIELTDRARLHIVRLLEKEQASGFRISIKKTGCSGYSYVPSIVQQAEAHDAILSDIADFPVFIDTQYAEFLQEVHIDLIEDNVMGLKQKKLVFNNPKEAGRCGCGESFHIKEQTEKE